MHIKFVYHAKEIFESWGYEVIILRSDRDYKSVFNHVCEHPRKHPGHKGMRYGFSISSRCSVKRDCKIRPINKYFKELCKQEDIIQYIGICTDEPARLESLHKAPGNVSLLEKYGYTEKMAKDLCESYNLLSPTYDLSKRGGCWFCPNAKLCEHVYMKQNMPDVWEEFVSLEDEDNLMQNKWNVFGMSLKMRDMEIDKYLAEKQNKK